MLWGRVVNKEEEEVLKSAVKGALASDPAPATPSLEPRLRSTPKIGASAWGQEERDVRVHLASEASASMARRTPYPGGGTCPSADQATGLERRLERRPAAHLIRAAELVPVPTAQPGKKEDRRRPEGYNARVSIQS